MENLILAIFTALIFLVSYLFSWMHLYFISGAVLMLYGIACYVVLYIRTRNLINTRGVFLVFWLFAIGLAALKIHPKQVDWQVETWLCLGVSTVFFLLGYDAGNRSNRIYEFQVFRTVDPFWMIVLFSALIFSLLLLMALLSSVICFCNFFACSCFSSISFSVSESCSLRSDC